MDYIPRQRNDRKDWFQNLSDNAVAQIAVLGAPPGEGTGAKAAADAILAAMQDTDDAAAALDAKRLIERQTILAQQPGLRGRIRNWKTLGAYPASGVEGILKLKGTEVTFDPGTYKPVLETSIEAGKIKIDFKLKGAEGVVIRCRLRGTATWQEIGRDTNPPYYDTAPLANAAVPEVREYMARGLVDDDEIGLDSDIVSITFAG